MRKNESEGEREGGREERECGGERDGEREGGGEREGERRRDPNRESIQTLYK